MAQDVTSKGRRFSGGILCAALAHINHNSTAVAVIGAIPFFGSHTGSPSRAPPFNPINLIPHDSHISLVTLFIPAGSCLAVEGTGGRNDHQCGYFLTDCEGGDHTRGGVEGAGQKDERGVPEVQGSRWRGHGD
jgi:hypothetical protein